MSTQPPQFNVAEFMNESIDGVLDTKIEPIPEGEHMAQVATGEKDIDLSSGVSPKNNKPWLRLDVMLNFTDPNLAAQLKREQVKGRYSIMLDLNEQGRLDLRPQRNVHLGKLRDAVGQNRPGAWNFNMLKGQPLKVKVKHKTLDSGDTISEVVSVTRAL